MKAKIDPIGTAAKPCQVVLDESDLKAIDAWRITQPGIPPRGSTIRHFFRKGMADWLAAQAATHEAA